MVTITSEHVNGSICTLILLVLLMVNDDPPNTTKPRKYRIVTQSHTTVKNLVDDPHTNGMPPSRLPALLSKSSVFPSTSGT